MYDWMDEAYDARDDDRPATEAEAHVEWHLNSGVPIGTPGCPYDACHADEHEEYEEEETPLLGLPPVPEWVGEPAPYPGTGYVPARALSPLDPDDIPF